MAAFFSALSTSDSLRLAASFRNAAGCTSRPEARCHRSSARTAPAGRRRKPVRRTRSAPGPHASAKVRTDQTALRPENPSSPVYAGPIRLSRQSEPAPAVSDRTPLREPADRSACPLLRIRDGCPKGSVPDHLVFGEAHKGVPPNGPARPMPLSRPFQALAQGPIRPHSANGRIRSRSAPHRCRIDLHARAHGRGDRDALM